jgi:hypothetical protein
MRGLDPKGAVLPQEKKNNENFKAVKDNVGLMCFVQVNIFQWSTGCVEGYSR